MALDIARVEYDRLDKKEKKKKVLSSSDDSIRLQEEANERMRQRREKESWQPIKLTDLDTNTQTNTY